MRLRFNAEGVGFSKERHLASALKNGPPDNGGLSTHGTPDAHQATRSIALACIADHGAKFRREVQQVQRLLRILICPSCLAFRSINAVRRQHAIDGGQGSTSESLAEMAIFADGGDHLGAARGIPVR